MASMASKGSCVVFAAPTETALMAVRQYFQLPEKFPVTLYM